MSRPNIEVAPVSERLTDEQLQEWLSSIDADCMEAIAITELLSLRAELEKAREEAENMRRHRDQTRTDLSARTIQVEDLVAERDSSRALLNRARRFLGAFSPESDPKLIEEIAAALEMSGGAF